MKKTIEVSSDRIKVLIDIVVRILKSTGSEGYYPKSTIDVFVDGKLFRTIKSQVSPKEFKEQLDELIIDATYAANILVGNTPSHYGILGEMGFDYLPITTKA